jgi:WD40 repeat protein
VIQCDDPEVEVIIRKGGEDVRIVDPASGNEITLKAGTYQVELKEGKEKGLRLSTDHFTLERCGKVIVEVLRQPSSRAKGIAEVPRQPPRRAPEDVAAAGPAVQVRLRGQFREDSALTGQAFSPDGRLLAVGREDGRVGLWDVAAAKRKAVLKVSELPVTGLAFSPDGKTLATAAGPVKKSEVGDTEIRLWNVDSGKEVEVLGKALVRDHRGPVTMVAITPDGDTLAAVALNGRVILWDVVNRKPPTQLNAGARSYSVAFSPDSRTVAAACQDGMARVWDVKSGQHWANLEGHTDALSVVAFSPDGKTLATGSRDHTARLWDARTFRVRGVLRHNNPIRSLSFSPNGKVLAVGDTGSFVKLWDVATGKEIADVPEPKVAVRAWVAFSPGGDVLATASSSRVVLLWDVIPPQGPAVSEVHGR